MHRHRYPLPEEHAAKCAHHTQPPTSSGAGAPPLRCLTMPPFIQTRITTELNIVRAQPPTRPGWRALRPAGRTPRRVLARKSCGTKSRPPVDRCENACNARANISNNGEMFSRKSEMNLGRRWTARGPSFIPPPLVVKMREMKDYA